MVSSDQSETFQIETYLIYQNETCQAALRKANLND
jgi:hypothetical protein